MKKMKTLRYGLQKWNVYGKESQNLERQLTMIRHILYHLPSEYDNFNNQYLKDLDDKKEIELEDLHADLRHKYD